jgi:hypothetical protein
MMQLNVSTRTPLLALAAVLLLNGCGAADKVAPGRKIDYRKSDTTEALEVPPDLSSTTINEAPAMVESISSTRYQDADSTIGKDAVLPDADTGSLRVERDGDQQWLVIQATPGEVWPRVREFWMQEGFLLKLEDPRVGIIETGWAENRADIPQGLPVPCPAGGRCRDRHHGTLSDPPGGGGSGDGPGDRRQHGLEAKANRPGARGRDAQAPDGVPGHRAAEGADHAGHTGTAPGACAAGGG